MTKLSKTEMKELFTVDFLPAKTHFFVCNDFLKYFLNKYFKLFKTFVLRMFLKCFFSLQTFKANLAKIIKFSFPNGA